MNYGIPYQGSKSKLLPELCKFFPPATNFYDLFGGGFSVTHAMLKHRSKSFKHFHFNEIRKGMTKLIQDSVSGKYNYGVFKPKFISREEFFEKKEKDLYIKLIWSFGNNGKDYLFGKEVEQEKKSIHNAIVFNQFDSYSKEILGMDKFLGNTDIKSRRLFLKNRLIVLKGERCDLQQLEQLERLQQLERLERLERLEPLQQQVEQQRLTFYNLDYKKVEIKNDSVIYCDIPYLGTGEYDKNKNFNHKEFYEWASGLDHPVFISEYTMPDKRFEKIWSKEVNSTMAAIGPTSARECLFCNSIAYKKLIGFKK